MILSRDEYDRLIEAAEDRADAEEARSAIERGKETLLTETKLDEYLAAKTPLAFWRRKRA